MNKQISDEKLQLCPNCKTGQDTYLLDSRSPFCPHIACHDGERCVMFVPLGNIISKTKSL